MCKLALTDPALGLLEASTIEPKVSMISTRQYLGELYLDSRQ